MLSADELGIILLSLKVAGASVLFSLPLALGCALLLARGSFPGKTLFDAVVHLPLVRRGRRGLWGPAPPPGP